MEQHKGTEEFNTYTTHLYTKQKHKEQRIYSLIGVLRRTEGYLTYLTAKWPCCHLGTLALVPSPKVRNQIS